ncbi:MAG: diadenylate cyclase CdaA [Pseudomonadota bacterium]
MKGWFENLTGLRDLLDILVVAVLIYWLLRLIRGTRAVYMLFGLSVAGVIYWISSWWELYTVNWIFSSLFSSLLLIAVVIFQNDIRRALTQIGRSPIFSLVASPQESIVVEELVKASTSLANKKIGALIVIERDANVLDYVDVGVPLDAVVSKELLTSVFHPVSPLHDGAVILQKGRITAAGCFLPLTMNPRFGVEVGTRHRAAIGLTEETDAAVIVISEEKGWISLASEGRITRGVDGAALRKILHGYLRPQGSIYHRFWRRIRRIRGEVA